MARRPDAGRNTCGADRHTEHEPLDLGRHLHWAAAARALPNRRCLLDSSGFKMSLGIKPSRCANAGSSPHMRLTCTAARTGVSGLRSRRTRFMVLGMDKRL